MQLRLDVAQGISNTHRLQVSYLQARHTATVVLVRLLQILDSSLQNLHCCLIMCLQQQNVADTQEDTPVSLLSPHAGRFTVEHCTCMLAQEYNK